MAHQQKVVYDLLNGTIFNDLQLEESATMCRIWGPVQN